MVAEVGRDVADAQSPLGIRKIGMRSDVLLERFGVPGVPAPAFFQDRPRVVTGMIVQDPDEITVDVGGVRLELECRAIGGDRLIELALLHEDVAEIHVGLGMVRLELDGLLIAGDRLLDPPQLPQQEAQVEGDLGVVRLEAQGLPQAGLGLHQLPLLLEDTPQVVVRLGEVRLSRTASRKLATAASAPLLPQGIAQVAVRHGMVRPGSAPPDGSWPRPPPASAA